MSIFPTSIVDDGSGNNDLSLSLSRPQQPPPPPPSLSLPKKKTQTLREENLYEPRSEAQLREEVLGRLDALANEWVRRVAAAVGYSDALPSGGAGGGDDIGGASSSSSTCAAAIFTFGSYRLGVHGPGADIDTLCVGPCFVERATHFFGDEPHCFQRMLLDLPDCAELQPVPDSFVPVIKMRLGGISIDLLYAKLAVTALPRTLDIAAASTLRGADEQSVRSLNGCRVTDTILAEVPPPPVAFRAALRFIKLWAERRGVRLIRMDGWVPFVSVEKRKRKRERKKHVKNSQKIKLFFFFFFFKKKTSGLLQRRRVPRRGQLGHPRGVRLQALPDEPGVARGFAVLQGENEKRTEREMRERERREKRRAFFVFSLFFH